MVSGYNKKASNQKDKERIASGLAAAEANRLEEEKKRLQQLYILEEGGDIENYLKAA